jgi:hypothetical protein
MEKAPFGRNAEEARAKLPTEKQQQTATVRRGIEGTIFGAKAGAGATNARLGRLVLSVAADR